ncbi:MAG: T9SS type A sorting domain-containing protein [Ignavibacterium sp.]
MQAVEFPVRIKLTNPSLRLTDENGNSLYNYVNSDGEIVIDNSSLKKIFITGEIVPSEVSLEQNYPNPFNPSTKIRYAISSREFVQLKVFDLLGNEVATLVNEEKPAGRYEVEFTVGNGNISNSSFLNKQITSGIYFYKLTAGEFSSVKKMILIK